MSKQSKPVQQKHYFLPLADSPSLGKLRSTELNQDAGPFSIPLKPYRSLSSMVLSYGNPPIPSDFTSQLPRSASAFWPPTTTWPGSPDSWGKAWHVLTSIHHGVTMIQLIQFRSCSVRLTLAKVSRTLVPSRFFDRSNIFHALTKLKEASSPGSKF